MSDTEDLALFAQIASQFGSELRRFGLLVVTELSRENTDTGGWIAKVATWRRNRPNPHVILDRSLGEERQFWFGFHSQRGALLDRFMEEMPQRYQNYERIGDDDWEEVGDQLRLKSRATELVKKAGGKVFERYKADDFFEGHYFGIYQMAFQYNTPEQLAIQAAEAVGDIVECIDPLLEEERDSQLGELKQKNPTEYRQVILARRGQGLFRRQLEIFWKGSCAVTGYNIPFSDFDGSRKSAHVRVLKTAARGPMPRARVTAARFPLRGRCETQLPSAHRDEATCRFQEDAFLGRCRRP